MSTNRRDEMASESQPSGNTKISANRMRLADRVKKIRDGIRVHMYSEFTEDAGDDVEIAEVEHEGNIVGRYVKKDGEVLETHASHDAQESGTHKEAAKAHGIKEDEITHTAPTAAAEGMVEEDADWAEGPEKIGSISDDQVDTPDEPETTTKASLQPGKTKENKQGDKTKTGDKPDNSLFKPTKGSSESAGDEGDFKAESAKAPKNSKQKESKSDGKPDKSMSKMASQDSGLEKSYDIKVEPGKITYTKQKPEEAEPSTIKQEPVWKQRWKSKPEAEKRAFRQKLVDQRVAQTKGGVIRKSDSTSFLKKCIERLRKEKDSHNELRGREHPALSSHPDPVGRAQAAAAARVHNPPKVMGLKKEEESPGLKALRERMKKPKQMKPGTRDEKIQAALEGQRGTNPYVEPGPGGGRRIETSRNDIKVEEVKPIVVKKYKKHQASGRPFHVLMGTRDAHKTVGGFHHTLDKPATLQQIRAMLDDPSSSVNRAMIDAHSRNNNRLIIHQPESDGRPVGHLRVIKSMSKSAKLFAALKKNAVAGYPSLGIPPAMPGDISSMSPMMMSKGKSVPKPKAEHATQGVRRLEKASNSKIRGIADKYAQSKGLKLNHDLPPVEINQDRAKKIAQAFHQMKHDPNHPDVKRSYDALINETMDQFGHILKHGLKVSKIQPGMENPYKGGSKDLFRDINENNHMWYFPTESGFGSGDKDFSDHPLMRQVKSPTGEPMVANDAFRIVHDYFGHAKEGTSFGPKGEEAAWRHHMQMYSPDAQKALTSETRGQNSWVNFGPHGEKNRSNPENTVYADQKAGLLPDWAHETDNETVKKSDDLTNHVESILQAHSSSGGSTYDLKTGHVSGNVYMVSPYLKRSEIIKEELTPEIISNFISKNKDLLEQPNHNVGTWYDPDEGVNFLDISVSVPDRESAMKIARDSNQKAIYHLGSGKVIPVGGTGKMKKAAKIIPLQPKTWSKTEQFGPGGETTYTPMKTKGLNEHNKPIGSRGKTGIHASGGIHRSSSIIARPEGGVLVLPSDSLVHDGGEARFETEHEARKWLDSLKPAKKRNNGIPF